MKKIEVEKITDKQKLIIRNGINTYLYIMSHKEIDNEDFRDIYYDFYLKARSSVFAKKKTNKETNKKEDNPNWKTYFNLLSESTGNETLEYIVKKLYTELKPNQSYEFSFATKLLHTKNSKVPIYDSKVRVYLNENYGIKFKTLQKSNLDNIIADWKSLNEWYSNFKKEDDYQKWIDWFDKQFPEGKKISDIKKIDFIIFACSK